MSRPGIYGDGRRHLVFATCGEPHLVIRDVPGFDADHAASGGVAQVGHRGSFVRPRVPHHRRRGIVFLDDDAAPPAAIFNDARRWGIEVHAVGLRPDSDKPRGLPLAPSRFGLVDMDGCQRARRSPTAVTLETAK